MRDVAVEETAELDNGATDSYRELREYLKGTTLKVNSSEMKDVDETWRKRNFGKVNLSTKKGLPIDVAYNELTERFGEGVFPSDVYAQSDMLYLIEDHLNAWAPRYGNPYEANLNEVREYYAQEILNSMLSDEIRQTPPTYADCSRFASCVPYA